MFSVSLDFFLSFFSFDGKRLHLWPTHRILILLLMLPHVCIGHHLSGLFNKKVCLCIYMRITFLAGFASVLDKPKLFFSFFFLIFPFFLDTPSILGSTYSSSAV